MSVFLARIASWTGEDVQRAEWVRSSGSCGGAGSTLHQDSSGCAARTWSNNARSPTLDAVSSAVRAGGALKNVVGRTGSVQNLENVLQRSEISLAVRGASWSR